MCVCPVVLMLYSYAVISSPLLQNEILPVCLPKAFYSSNTSEEIDLCIFYISPFLSMDTQGNVPAKASRKIMHDSYEVGMAGCFEGHLSKR